MADIELNKPLYKAGSGGGAADASKADIPPPRPPKSNSFARCLALLVDFLVLHGLFRVLLALFPQPLVQLGWFGPFVGLSIGWLYLSVCTTGLTLGKTIGKLLLRVEVTDLSGAHLSFRHAAVRELIILLPFISVPITQYIAFRLDTPERMIPPDLITVMGWRLVVGWLGANGLYAFYDPMGRCLWDRLTGTIVINGDGDPKELSEFLSKARSPEFAKGCFRSRLAFGLGAAALITLSVTQYVAGVMYVRQASPDVKAMDFEQKKAAFVPGFGGAVPAGSGRVGDKSAKTNERDLNSSETMDMPLQFRSRGPIDLEKLRADPVAMSRLDSYINFQDNDPAFKDGLFYNINLRNKSALMFGQAPTTIPKQMLIEVSFAEHADLLLAQQSYPVFAQSKLMNVNVDRLQTSATLDWLSEVPTSGTVAGTTGTVAATTETTTTQATAVTTGTASKDAATGKLSSP